MIQSRIPAVGLVTKVATMVSASFDLAVDFMDMTADRRLWTRLVDARAGFTPVVGRFVIVGCEDADPAVAQILSVDAEGRIELEVLPGSVDSHRSLLESA
jgi:hypothetical protein